MACVVQGRSWTCAPAATASLRPVWLARCLLFDWRAEQMMIFLVETVASHCDRYGVSDSRASDYRHNLLFLDRWDEISWLNTRRRRELMMSIRLCMFVSHTSEPMRRERERETDFGCMRRRILCRCVSFSIFNLRRFVLMSCRRLTGSPSHQIETYWSSNVVQFGTTSPWFKLSCMISYLRLAVATKASSVARSLKLRLVDFG